VKVPQKKNQIQQRSYTDNCLVIDRSDNFSNSVLYLAENWMRGTVSLSLETENWKWLLRLEMSTALRPRSARCGFGKFHSVIAVPRDLKKF